MNNKKKIVFGCTLIGILSFSTVVFGATGIVTGKTVRIRESADASSNIVTNAYRNDEIKIISDEGEWYKVEYEGSNGYISKEFVEVQGGETVPSESSTQNTQVNNESTQQTNQENTENKEETKPEEKSEPVTTSVQPESLVNQNAKIKKSSKLKILPTFSSIDIGVIEENTEVTISEELNNWLKITAGSNVGWVLKNNVEGYGNSSTAETTVVVTNSDSNENATDSQKQEDNKVSSETKGYINIDTARIRETAGGKIIGNLDFEDEVTILGEEGDWYKITTKNFESGYVSKSLVTIGSISSRSLEEERKAMDIGDEARKQAEEAAQRAAEEQKAKEQAEAEARAQAEAQAQAATAAAQAQSSNSSKGEEVVNYAKSFLGCRYVSGGTSPSGFDCSGFTQYVYAHFGYSLARVASSQSQNGVNVDRSNLQLGDILVFQDYGRTCIGHVGIYIGNGNFIHAANPSRGVVTDNLNSNSYYNVRFVCARRIIN